VRDIEIFKLQDDKNTVYRFPRAAFSGELKAGQYAVTKNDDFNITAGSSERLEGGEVLYIAIEDDSVLDYDKTAGQIFDPPFIGAKHNASGNTGAGDGSGGGGCDAGFGAAAAILLAAMAIRPRRKRR
jgi:Synergist-CTERM protein sorting domain-containing protein